MKNKWDIFYEEKIRIILIEKNIIDIGVGLRALKEI